jgi:hypothetical protein
MCCNPASQLSNALTNKESINQSAVVMIVCCANRANDVI